MNLMDGCQIKKELTTTISCFNFILYTNIMGYFEFDPLIRGITIWNLKECFKTLNKSKILNLFTKRSGAVKKCLEWERRHAQ